MTPGRIDRLTAVADGPAQIPVPRPLLRALSTAGVTKCGDVDRLSTEQVARTLENKTLSEQIALKQLIHAAGLYPRDAADVRPLDIFAGR